MQPLTAQGSVRMSHRLTLASLCPHLWSRNKKSVWYFFLRNKKCSLHFSDLSTSSCNISLLKNDTSVNEYVRVNSCIPMRLRLFFLVFVLMSLGKMSSWQVSDILVSDRTWLMQTVRYYNPSDSESFCLLRFLPHPVIPLLHFSPLIYIPAAEVRGHNRAPLFSSLESAPVTAVKSQASAAS